MIACLGRIGAVLIVLLWVRSLSKADWIDLRGAGTRLGVVISGGSVFVLNLKPATPSTGLHRVSSADEWEGSAWPIYVGNASNQREFLGFRYLTILDDTILPDRIVGLPLWFVVLLLAVEPARSGWSRIAARLRVRRGLCAHCGYDLRASAGRCPECGATRAMQN